MVFATKRKAVTFGASPSPNSTDDKGHPRSYISYMSYMSYLSHISPC